jgi:NAD+ diphosphatase
MDHSPRFAADSLKKVYPDTGYRIGNESLWIMVRGTTVSVTKGPSPTIFFHGLPGTPENMTDTIQYLGHRESTACYAIGIKEDAEGPANRVFSGVRDLAGTIPDEELAIAGLAVQIIDFDRMTRFCGRCGAEMQQTNTERAKTCPSCNFTIYPRLSPAIIVLVRNDNRILLVRSKNAPQGRYSLVAGFVEPGETIEHAVHREVREETGIEITNVRYLASEPWPFPNSLMIGFIADYVSGDIVADGIEIESVGWFDRDHVPRSPVNLSIARSIIDWWIEGMRDTL